MTFLTVRQSNRLTLKRQRKMSPHMLPALRVSRQPLLNNISPLPSQRLAGVPMAVQSMTAKAPQDVLMTAPTKNSTHKT